LTKANLNFTLLLISPNSFPLHDLDDVPLTVKLFPSSVKPSYVWNLNYGITQLFRCNRRVLFRSIL